MGKGHKQKVHNFFPILDIYFPVKKSQAVPPESSFSASSRLDTPLDWWIDRLLKSGVLLVLFYYNYEQ